MVASRGRLHPTRSPSAPGTRAPPCSRAPSPSVALTGFLFLLFPLSLLLPLFAALFRTESSRYVALVIRYRWRSRRYFLLEAGMHHARLIAAAHDACDAILSIDRETVTLFCRLSLKKIEKEKEREKERKNVDLIKYDNRLD